MPSSHFSCKGSVRAAYQPLGERGPRSGRSAVPIRLFRGIDAMAHVNLAQGIATKPAPTSARDSDGPDLMCMGTVPMSDTRLSLLGRVRDLADGESWREFHAIYQPLICGYLRGLGLKEPDAHDLTQEV